MVIGQKQRPLDPEILRQLEKLKTSVVVMRHEISVIEKTIEALGGSATDFYTCPSCEFFNEGHCSYFDDKVPNSVWSKGCDNWSDRIPF
jgi:hypothetical protein